MNTIEHTVTKVKSIPYFNHMWCVNVDADSWGRVFPAVVYCKTEDEAKSVKVGYKFNG